MSFSSKVKGEICRYVDITKSEALAQISAIMKVSGTIGFSGKGITFRITTENPGSARLIFTLLKDNFNIHSKLSLIHIYTFKIQKITQKKLDLW